MDCLDYLVKVAGSQLDFHKINEIRSHNIGHRLHATATTLFALTVVGIGIHLFLEISDSARQLQPLHDALPATVRGSLDRWLLLASATLPALAAAIAGISNQGEFVRLAKRSAAMADSFVQSSAQIAALRSDQLRAAPRLLQVSSVASRIADVMVDEVADWRVVFTDRPNTAT